MPTTTASADIDIDVSRPRIGGAITIITWRGRIVRRHDATTTGQEDHKQAELNEYGIHEMFP